MGRNVSVVESIYIDSEVFMFVFLPDSCLLSVLKSCKCSPWFFIFPIEIDGERIKFF